MNEFKIDLSRYIDNFKIDKDKAKQYGGYKKIANDLSKENIKLAFENAILQSKIDKAIELIEKEDLIAYFRETNDLTLANEFEDLYKYLKEDK